MAISSFRFPRLSVMSKKSPNLGQVTLVLAIVRKVLEKYDIFIKKNVCISAASLSQHSKMRHVNDVTLPGMLPNRFAKYNAILTFT